jgi:peptidyl-prolyl cis-trans isomerase C
MIKLSLSVFLAAAAFSAYAADLPPDTPLVVGPDATIQAADYEAALTRVPERYRAEMRMSPEKISTMVDGLFIGKSIANKARKLGLDKDPLVQRRLQQAQEQVLADLYLQKIERDAKIPNLEGRAREVYNGNPKRFRTEEHVYIQQILVSYNERTQEMALARAKEVEAQVRQPGTDFMAVARATTEDPDRRRNGGDLGWYALSSFDPMIIAWAGAVKEKGAISAPIQTNKGYHILKFVDRRPGQLRPFEEVKKGLIEEERAQVIKTVRDEAIQAVRNDPAVVIHAANVEALRIPVDPALFAPRSTDTLPADAAKRANPALPK